jgi:hypothetical protein
MIQALSATDLPSVIELMRRMGAVVNIVRYLRW